MTLEVVEVLGETAAGASKVALGPVVWSVSRSVVVSGRIVASAQLGAVSVKLKVEFAERVVESAAPAATAVSGGGATQLVAVGMTPVESAGLLGVEQGVVRVIWPAAIAAFSLSSFPCSFLRSAILQLMMLARFSNLSICSRTSPS